MMLFRLFGVAAIVGFSACPSPGLAPVSKDAGGNQPAPEVRVVGVYEGTYPPGVRHRGGFHPPGAVTVKVGEVKKPVILVLTSYEPVVWKVEAPKGAVVRVIASGFYKQAVEGLDEKVPVTLISREARDKDYFYVHRQEAGPNATDHERDETKRQYDRLVARVKELTKQDIKGFQGKYAGKTFEVR
jgi:hypothetical protein